MLRTIYLGITQKPCIHYPYMDTYMDTYTTFIFIENPSEIDISFLYDGKYGRITFSFLFMFEFTWTNMELYVRRFDIFLHFTLYFTFAHPQKKKNQTNKQKNYWNQNQQFHNSHTEISAQWKLWILSIFQCYATIFKFFP